jgi:hypothetical protein
MSFSFREQGPLPWGIERIGSMYHPDCQSELPDGRWVASVGEPYHCNWFEAVRAAWWVLTGRAHAVIWPDAGDLEAIWLRDRPILRDRPLPFVKRS